MGALAWAVKRFTFLIRGKEEDDPLYNDFSTDDFPELIGKPHELLTKFGLDLKAETIEDAKRLPAGQGIAEMAKIAYTTDLHLGKGKHPKNALTFPGDHCWDWINNVYKANGVNLGTTPQVYRRAGYPKRSSKGIGENAEFDPTLLKEGDHVIYHNGNSYDVNGSHSAIYLGFKNGRHMCASMPYPDHRPRIHSVDFSTQKINQVRSANSGPLITS